MIPPGGEGEIKATLKTAGREGPLKKRITVTSNDPDSPNLSLNIEGEILVDLSVTPRKISYGQLGKGEGGKREFEIAVADPEKVKVTERRIDDERFTIKKLSEDAPGRSKWELDFKGSKDLGRLSAQIIIKYDGSDVSETSLPVRASVVGDLQYTNNLYFSKKEEDGGFQEQELVFTSRSGKDVAIKNVKDPDGKLVIKIVTPKGKKAVLKASVADSSAAPSKPERHEFTVGTSDPDEAEVTIRYTITKRRPGRPPRMDRKAGAPGMMRPEPGIPGQELFQGKGARREAREEGEQR